jgi:hypothetical protein
MTPESRRFNEQRSPAMVQRRMSTLRRSRRSSAFLSSVSSPLVDWAPSWDGMLYVLSLVTVLYVGGCGEAMSALEDDAWPSLIVMAVSSDFDWKYTPMLAVITPLSVGISYRPLMQYLGLITKLLRVVVRGVYSGHDTAAEAECRGDERVGWKREESQSSNTIDKCLLNQTVR